MAAALGAGGSAAAASAGGSSAKGSVPAKLPCTILSGFLGSGKTTLLTHILRNKEGLRCAVIVNDMAELNIDASLIRKGAKLVQAEERMVEITNGCICCTLRDDLAVEVGRLAAEGCFDYCVIESTGIGEPMQVAETFELAAGEGGPQLRDVATLDTCVTVVDAANLMANFSSVESLKDRGEQVDAEDERGVAELLLDQIEFADVILLNKVDLVSAEEQRRLLALLRTLNPGAEIIPTRHSEVPLSRVINTGRFSFEQAQQNAGWLQSLNERHTPETEEYDISSIIYRARRPFHPGRLHDFLTSHFVLQEPDWSEALEREHDHANCDGHPNHYGHHHGRQQPSAFSAQPTERLSSSVQAAVLHASQAAQQAASALQTIVQEQAAAASGGSNPQQQALLATVAAATSAAAAASSAAAILLAQLQLGAGSGAATAQAVAQPASSSQAQQLHSPAHPHPHSHYHQQGLAVSAEEAHRRQERLTAECGQLCRSKGFVWLATRPDLCGEWSQAGGIMRLGVGGPWYAALPDEAWPEEEEARQQILKDFQEPHGDRRQELVLIGVRLNAKALSAALDGCLCTEAEMAAAEEGRLDDPFLEWPSLEQILDAGEEDEDEDEEDEEAGSDEELSTVEEEGEEGEAGPPPGAVHVVTYGAAELHECFEACAARLAPEALGVVSWHANWVEPCREAAAEMVRLAAAHPGAAFFCLDVEGSSANAAFAREKVVRNPESRRQGAKPVLKSGERFPCITLHYLPSLEPVATLAGPGAVEQLRAALREHAPAAAQPAVVAAAPVSAPAAAAAPASGSLVALKRGAAEFKEVLAAARDATQPVIVIWRSSSAGAGDSAAGTALLAAAVQAAGGVVVVDADVSASNSIQLLAGALKVAAFPEVHAYRGMKLESKLAPAQATPAALLRLAALLAPAAAGGTIASTRANGNTAAATAAAAPSVAALAAEQPLAVAPSSRGDGTWDPPGGKFAKPGATRRFPDGRLGHFFPKMPCLRCGCPWWSSEDWDARCLRCAWDCESGGYDNDSQPLPRHRPKWEQLVAVIREGRTPAWAPKR